MRKIVPLVNLNQVENYLSNGVDKVLMGSYFSAARQVEVFTIQEMIEVNEKIPVVGCFNRFYFEHELNQLKHEIKSLVEGGIEEITASDLAVLEIVFELGLDVKVILDTDTTMTNIDDVKTMHDMGADEVVLGRELTLDEIVSISKETNVCGMHFFGYQLMSASRRKHLTQYAQYRNVDIRTGQLYWMKEAKRDALYMTLEDHYGTHIYAPDVYSGIHVYQTLKEAGIQTLYFDVMGLEIEDVLFVVRSLDILEDYDQFETILSETCDMVLTHGLLYQETEKGK
ncbi:hypothetical protein AOC36_01740 [Erysipelothrix larvae]|uniref:Peptidase U32 n=1 Tax=Erysipelothrix larvae TaxID=1514105 RepID=A0A0X8GYH8_9FIRM|nr:U32 family peptidase [Erysipelothrix larvae]AMC92752.1 hypothetical protein AOC36_01740 [Erysipelothrix larvae]